MRVGVASMAAAAGLFVCMAAVPGFAQIPGSPATTGFQPLFKPRVKPEAPKQTAPALPGATPGLGAGPADNTTADQQPNDELFDAINRGDIGSAKDAISRGADLEATNILGMTPLELSVDLSRNDITFLLLSYRDAARPVTAQLATATLPLKPAGTKSPALRISATKPHTHLPTPSAAPRVYATRTDSGAPDPQAGFLGFGEAGR